MLPIPSRPSNRLTAHLAFMQFDHLAKASILSARITDVFGPTKNSVRAYVTASVTDYPCRHEGVLLI